MNQPMFASGFFRAVFYMPSIISGVALVTIEPIRSFSLTSKEAATSDGVGEKRAVGCGDGTGRMRVAASAAAAVAAVAAAQLSDGQPGLAGLDARQAEHRA